MAKTRKKGGASRTTAAGLDKSLAQVKTRLAKWRAERDALAAHLREVIENGEHMLAELGDEAAAAARRGGSAARKAARRGKRRLSPEGRARIIAAAKKRWAQYRKDKGK